VGKSIPAKCGYALLSAEQHLRQPEVDVAVIKPGVRQLAFAETPLRANIQRLTLAQMTPVTEVICPPGNNYARHEMPEPHAGFGCSTMTIVGPGFISEDAAP
jgi:hypothetical protein